MKNTDYDTKVSEIEKRIIDLDYDKYITAPRFIKLTTEIFKARLKQADLVTKTDFDNKLQILSKRITSNKTKHLLVDMVLDLIEKESFHLVMDLVEM